MSGNFIYEYWFWHEILQVWIWDGGPVKKLDQLPKTHGKWRVWKTDSTGKKSMFREYERSEK